MNRAARQVERLAEQFAFQHSVRAIESVHKDIHDILLQWGRWGHSRSLQSKLPPFSSECYARPAIWSLPGEYDPGIEPDENAAPDDEAAPIPIDERAVVSVDGRINDQGGFPALWVKLLKVNYIWRPIEWDRPLIARIGQQAYLDQLHRALEELG